MLYQKHRPQTFEDVVGNRNLVATLKSAIKDKNKFPHALLFVGEYGCGKTSLARIVANELECHENNLIEIDTAQFTGIDTVRDIRKSAQFTPLGGGVRVFIIDEVARASKDAQNAFLKILEDTPPHIYFILCTTDENSLIPTIRSRCSRYQVSLLSDAEMNALLTEVVSKENEKLDSIVFEQIVKSAQGHPRNALTILEQVLATPEKRRLKVAEQAQIVETESIELCRALLARKGWTKVKEILKNLKANDDAESVRRLVLGYMTSVILNKEDDQCALILECFAEPFYNSGFSGLVLASYQVCKG
jgi:DNA polymerase-3 subunit gamma/tau